MMNESDEKPEISEPPSPPVVEAIQALPESVAVDNERVRPDSPEILQALQWERLTIECDRLRDELEEAKDVHDLRKEYVPKLFWLTVAWLVFVVVLIWKVAEGPYFYLSDRVLIALVTSTTVNVIGIFMLAARWLFPPKK